MADAQPEIPFDQADPLLGYKDISRMLKVHIRTVKRWDTQGLLPRPSFQVGSFRRWRQSVIVAWVSIGGSRWRGAKVDKKGQTGASETESSAQARTKRDK